MSWGRRGGVHALGGFAPAAAEWLGAGLLAGAQAPFLLCHTPTPPPPLTCCRSIGTGGNTTSYAAMLVNRLTPEIEEAAVDVKDLQALYNHLRRACICLPACPV